MTQIHEGALLSNRENLVLVVVLVLNIRTLRFKEENNYEYVI